MFNSGFTLIELIIVILIVSVFGAVAAPAYTDYKCANDAEYLQDNLKACEERITARLAAKKEASIQVQHSQTVTHTGEPFVREYNSPGIATNIVNDIKMGFANDCAIDGRTVLTVGDVEMTITCSEPEIRRVR